MSQPITLVYRGSGADLTFRSAGARRHVLRGVPFEADDATATILLSDSAVERFVPEQAITALVSASAPEVPLEEMTMAQLQVAAAGLGVTFKARTPKPAMIAALRSAQAHVAAPEPVAAEPVPEAEATDEAPASDPTPRPGSITLEDIPAAGRIQQQG